MTTVHQKAAEPIKNDNLKNLKPIHAKGGHQHALKSAAAPEAPAISDTAKNLNQNPPPTSPASPTTTPEAPQTPNVPDAPNTPSATSAASSATSVAKTLSQIPVLPIITPSESKDAKKLEEKISDSSTNPKEKITFIKKPAVIFIEGFSAFGISDGDGIKDMADNLPGSKRFSWNEQSDIIEEIKKHAPDQPVVLVGHSFGGDSAVEIANTLNSVKNGFRSIDLLVSIDSVGMNNNIIPMNVKRNLNFFGEGMIPFLHGDPNAPRDSDRTEVQNELRSEIHSRMDDSEEVQFKIFEAINGVLAETNHQDLFEEIQKNDQLKKIIDSHPHHLKS